MKHIPGRHRGTGNKMICPTRNPMCQYIVSYPFYGIVGADGTMRVNDSMGNSLPFCFTKIKKSGIQQVPMYYGVRVFLQQSQKTSAESLPQRNFNIWETVYFSSP
jgi:hypothetical protein